MDRLEFGLSLATVGMGGTLLSLLLLSFIIKILTRLFGENGQVNKEG